MALFRKKKGLPISNHITAIDGKVIARKGDRVNNDLIENLLDIKTTPPGPEITLENTLMFGNFEVLLSDPKYRFILSEKRSKDFILSILAPVNLNPMFVKELDYLKRLPYHYHHTLVVAALTARMVVDLFHDVNKARLAVSCALCHDFGILRVPENILSKVSPLDEDEVKILREHPVYSYILLTYYMGASDNLEAVVGFEHHENLLGTGYPRGIVQKNLYSQFIQICDIFDALISSRPFRPAHNIPEALKIMSSEAEAGKLNAEAIDLLTSYLCEIS